MSEWLGAFLVFIPAVFVVLIKLGYNGRDHVVGIDLGTTYSVIGISEDGNVSILKDEEDRFLFPSVVSFTNSGVLVAHAAKEEMVRNPDNTIFNAKRFIGRSFDDPVVDLEKPMYDFTIVENKETGRTCFEVESNRQNKCVSPIEIGTYVVNHLLQVAAVALGHDQFTSAVVAVPADFNDIQRKATIEAFETTGLRVARVLDEPTAAAIAYGLHQDPSVTYVLVFDFGGGTLDVSLLYIHEESIQVIGTAGDNHLGGEDVDQAISQFLATEFSVLLGEPISGTDSDLHQKMDIYPCTRTGIRRIAETVKITLSQQTSTVAQCMVHHATQHTSKDSVLSVTVTRDQFESTCDSLFQRTLLPIHKVLQDADMDTDTVDEVVLVGGSSRIPWIHHTLTNLFQNRPPNSHIDPDIAVAYGAARVVD